MKMMNPARLKLRENRKVKKTDILPDDPDDRLHTTDLMHTGWIRQNQIEWPVPVNRSIGVQPADDSLAKTEHELPGLSVGGGSPEEGGFGLEFSDNSASSKTLT